MKFCCLLLLLSLYTTLSFSQNYLHDPYSGRQFNAQKYSNVRGSAFVNSDWLTGDAYSKNGVYKDLKLKLNAYENTLYVNKSDELFEFKEDIIAFVLKPIVGDTSTYQTFKKGFTGNSLKADQYVQVLAEGNISFYKSVAKALTETNEINEGVVKSFSQQTRYYVKKDSEITLFKSGKKDLSELFQDKWPTVQSYIDKNSLGFKNDGDLSKIFKYYNTL